MIKTEKALKGYLPDKPTYLKHHIASVVTAGVNSKIQSTKDGAREFGNFEHYRIFFIVGNRKRTHKIV